MKSIKATFVDVVGREPEQFEIESIEAMLARAPDALKEDPAFLVEQVLRGHHLGEINRSIDKLMITSREYATSQGETYAMAVADKVWRRVMDNLPWHAQTDAASRFQRYSVILAILFLLGFISGWSCLRFAYAYDRQSNQVLSETAFAACIDGAVGASVTASGKAARTGAIRSDVFVNRARLCAADYADRRATGL
ncbi:hypothetical protein GVO57_13545 [Sphingomonas changnyeongensis]|uniref:Uncharacterized protein n=1 Tax=Sphingomonas changnyeongensis TaxID=2698679 RepID=A0A7Z2S5Z4_9SPHN|nr:hypothetical protein [Sphingomonas changnyeongensis]QHL91635.1 hypothetical protein GVO57_13545 [Sphingomonas changnyeongensis]